ncbi:MAG: aminotransferase class III-fold pyridoxal phosphate-dependent enzyme [Candidatus Woesearchaeota archaeon]
MDYRDVLGPKSRESVEKIKKYSANNYEPYPFVVKWAEGPWLYDVDNNRALDFLSAYSSILSHNYTPIVDAVKLELDCGSDLVSRAVYSSRYADFAELITSLTGYDRVLSKSDGGSATDSALSGILMHGHEHGIKDPEVILTENYFHGRTWPFASNALFDPDQSYRRIPRSPGIRVVHDDIDSISEAVNNNTVGIFIETHKGEGGPLFSTKKHFMDVKNLAKENNLIFGCDEIQTGLGRCGYLMAWQEFGEEARPDFVTLGKALGGGIIPVSAVVGTEDFMEIYTPGSDGSTFGGYPLACAAAIASLESIVKQKVPERSLELGDYFVDKLKDVDGVNAENKGLLIRVEINGAKSAKPACIEMLTGDYEPRVFMKAGHYSEEKDAAYARIAPPPLALDKELIDYALDNTVIPVLKKHAKP